MNETADRDPDNLFREAMSASEWRRHGHAMVEILAAHLERCDAEIDGPVMPPVSPTTTRQAFGAPFTAQGGASFEADVARILAASTRLHHRRFVGHQVASPLPFSAIVDLMSSLLNNGMAVHEMGPAATGIERAVIAFFAGLAGFPEDAEGLMTSGGSVGNLTALLAARQIKGGMNARGEMAVDKPVLFHSDQAHYSVTRATHAMGWGADGVVAVPSDERYKMSVAALEEAIVAARTRGRTPLIVFASACSTATGSYDPLAAIADVCAEEDLWLHVDGAHGAGALLSPELSPRLAGVERADSLVWDAHKLMMVPALATAVIFRNPAHVACALSPEASYLFGGDAESEWYNTGHRTLECTKTMMAAKIWLSLRHYGTDFFRRFVEGRFALARTFAQTITASDDFELAVEPESNIVCFRHRPVDADEGFDLDAHQRRLRAAVIASGRFYLVQTTLRGRTWLRTTLTNPLTTSDDLDQLLVLLRET